MLSRMTNVLTVAGSDPIGGAGIQADLKAIESLGIHACTVITCATSQNTMGVQSISPVPPPEVGRQIDSVLADIIISAIKTGMLYDDSIVRTVAKRLRPLKVPLVVDPVMRATAGGTLSSRGFAEEVMSRLVPLATIATPNIHEAKALTGIEVRGQGSAHKAARVLLKEGAEAVLIKGGHLGRGDVVDYLFQEGRVKKMTSPRIKGDTHGTGCALSALIASHLALDASLTEAVEKSRAAVLEGIRLRERIGGGVPCVNPLGAIRTQASRASVLEELNEAVPALEQLLTARLLPEVGSNMAYAIAGATDLADVAAFEGRIVRIGQRAETTGCVRFGASKHVGRIVLAASAKDPSVRCALNIKYTRDNIRACRHSGLEVASFDRSREPKRSSSMTWGVTYAIERFGRVPDVVFDRGGIGKEPMIRILGETPAEVVDKLKRVSTELG